MPRWLLALLRLFPGLRRFFVPLPGKAPTISLSGTRPMALNFKLPPLTLGATAEKLVYAFDGSATPTVQLISDPAATVVVHPPVSALKVSAFVIETNSAGDSANGPSAELDIPQPPPLIVVPPATDLAPIITWTEDVAPITP
jgi:hypothetical protein